MSLCADCVKGVRHEGTLEGQLENIGGIECYTATPAGDFPKDKVLLFLPDAFGISLINSRLLVDDFARNGFKTVAPDIFNGDPVPEDYLDSKRQFSLADWFKTHAPEHTRPTIDKVVTALKEQGVKHFAATGYCFGGRYCFDLAFDNVVDAVVVSHPSLLKIPEDLEKYAKNSKAPLLINSCTTDSQFPLEAQAQADRILGGGQFAPGYKREYWDGCTHGFAVRGDLSDLKVKQGKEGSFKAAVLWFKQYL
ncbi:hypothetical protein PLEOSDRAFT_1076398 [Pleurotus ostreatus PC15]|uniref:Dienelactone hydrolase domain-containing protein n=2 Tax=Pleurotus TaxID=5320 RepID=A0A067NZZ4_PLEO1|nr:hypothetical protein CCMSSC00406_0001239 [Pleurotus cornucopiae]KDQ29712.1 hypothetical protein PLEOSDRAFT_1076398 [Pleurotus ostreatus PC15]